MLQLKSYCIEHISLCVAALGSSFITRCVRLIDYIYIYIYILFSGQLKQCAVPEKSGVKLSTAYVIML